MRLLCEREELLKRVASPERKAKHKMVNAEELAIRLETIEVFKPDHAHLLELDITAMPPQDAASRILTHIHDIIH